MHLLLRVSLLLFGSASLSVAQTQATKDRDDFGVLVMAHGGSEEWNTAVLEAVAPLAEDYRLEVAFGMADAASLQDSISRLEVRGVKRIGVVRLFISGDSWYERTQQILGLLEGAPDQPVAQDHDHRSTDDHTMEFWRVETDASFAVSREGLADAEEAGAILADRARRLSVDPQHEDVLILAHGPEDDVENERWLASIDAHADAVRKSLPFRRVRVDSLREDWPEKRAAAERRIREFVQTSLDEGGKTVVIPFRVQGFGPYAEVLDGLDYIADGEGLLPHEAVTAWIRLQAESLHSASFRPSTR
jgi:sirohydrochlorin ferrochelatase